MSVDLFELDGDAFTVWLTATSRADVVAAVQAIDRTDARAKAAYRCWQVEGDPNAGTAGRGDLRGDLAAIIASPAVASPAPGHFER